MLLLKYYTELETLYNILTKAFTDYNNETNINTKNEIYLQQIITPLADYERKLNDITSYENLDCPKFGGKKGRKTNKRRTKRNKKANKRTKKMKKSKTKKVKKMKKINRNKLSKKIKNGSGNCGSIPQAECVDEIPTADPNTVKLGMSTTVKKLIKSGIITEAEAEIFDFAKSNASASIVQKNK